MSRLSCACTLASSLDARSMRTATCRLISVAVVGSSTPPGCWLRQSTTNSSISCDNLVSDLLAAIRCPYASRESALVIRVIAATSSTNAGFAAAAMSEALSRKSARYARQTDKLSMIRDSVANTGPIRSVDCAVACALNSAKVSRLSSAWVADNSTASRVVVSNSALMVT